MYYRSFYVLVLLLFCTCLFAGELSYENRYKFDYFFLDAICSKQKNEHTKAFNALQYILRIDSTSPVVLYELSKYYLFLKKEKLALNALRKAVSYAPSNSVYKIALANLSRELGNDNEAIALYKELVKENLQDPELNYYLSNLYVKQQNIDKAIEVLNGIENNIVGINEGTSLQKSQLYRSIGKKKQALKELRRLAEKFPTEAKYQILIGDFYLYENEVEKALSFYKKAKIIDPETPYYFVAMFNYYKIKGEDEASIKEIEKALKDPTLDVEVKLNILGEYIENLYANKKKEEVANTLFEILMKQYSQNKELNRMYGKFLLLQDKKEEAKSQFQIVTKSTPEDFEAWTQLLNIVLQEGNSDEIISVCKKALIYFPNKPEFYLYKGIAYFLKKAYKNALDIYLKGLKIIPTDSTLLLSTFSGQIGDLYYQLGDKKKSFAFYEQALKYNDKNIAVMNNYAYYLSLAKENLDKAEKMASTVIQIQPNNLTYLDTYAWILFLKENYSLAKFYIENAFSKNDAVNSEILEHYGDILYRTGNIDKAVSKWQEALLLRKEEKENIDILKKKITEKKYYENTK